MYITTEAAHHSPASSPQQISGLRRPMQPKVRGRN